MYYVITNLSRILSKTSLCMDLRFLHCVMFQNIKIIYFLKAYHLVMTMTKTKTCKKTNAQTKTQTQTNTKALQRLSVDLNDGHFLRAMEWFMILDAQASLAPSRLFVLPLVRISDSHSVSVSEPSQSVEMTLWWPLGSAFWPWR